MTRCMRSSANFISRVLQGQNFKLLRNRVDFLRLSAAQLAQNVQFKLSDIGEGIAEVQIKEWFVKPGDQVKEFDNICEVQSDKASVTITSRYSGIIKKLYHRLDDIAKLGQPLVDIELDNEESCVVADALNQSDTCDTLDSASTSSIPSVSNQETKLAFETVNSEIIRKPLATPAVRRIAREHNVNLINVEPSGKDGRILKEDVLKCLEITDTKKESIVESATVTSNPVFQDTKVEIKGYARIMLKSMASTVNVPHFGYCDEICVDSLVNLKAQLKTTADKLDVKMSYMPFFIKACSLALKQYPRLNSSLDDSLQHLIYKSAHNICVAIDTPNGLVVPNLKNCQSKNIWQIAKDLVVLRKKAEAGQLSKDDILNGTFTLSNIGSIGGTYASPVILPPQVAIGALGKIQVVPKFDEKMQVVPTRMVKISWSADHRIIDGATMANFSNLLRQYVENPASMIAEMI